MPNYRWELGLGLRLGTEHWVLLHAMLGAECGWLNDATHNKTNYKANELKERKQKILYFIHIKIINPFNSIKSMVINFDKVGL